MSWTKRQFVTQAFEEAGLAAYVFNLTPAQLESALRRLDSMMATWNAQGLRLGYPLPGKPEDSDLDQDSGVPDAANEAIYLNLAQRIAPAFGKTVPIELKVSAKSAYDVLLGRAAQPGRVRMPSDMPAGAGNRSFGTFGPAFMPGVPDSLSAGPDGELELA